MDPHPIRNDDRLWEALGACRQSFYGVGIFSAIINILMLAPSLYMLQVYDRVLASGNEMTLLMLTLLMVGLCLFMGALEWVRSLVVIRLGTRLDLRLNQRVFNAAFERNLRDSDSKAGQALTDLTLLRQFVTGNALFAFFDAPWFPLFLCVVFLLHPWLGMLALGGAIFLIILTWLNQRVTRRPLAEANKLSMQATHQANTHLRNAEVIEAMGMLGNMRHRWLSQHYGFIRLQNLASERSAAINALSKSSRIILQSLMLGLGALLAVKGEITAGMMIAGSILVGRVLSPIDQLIGVWKQWVAARQAWHRLHLLLQSHAHRDESMILPAPTGNLSVDHLSFRPDTAQPPRLYNIHFTLRAGETLGILGASGSGKSTLARLLVAVQTPSQGTIRLDGADMNQLDKDVFGAYVGYLPQDIQLFSGTLAENIARFAHPDAEKTVAAAKLAGVHELILSLPQGYDTLLGEGGAGLSGGQRQRVALARAVYGDPCLLVLDEPNASLDMEGDRALLMALEALQQRGCTIVLITHRPALTARAHKLLILNQGSQQRFGSVREVMTELQQMSAANQSALKPEPQTVEIQG
ncbi:type I secretion system permease/ATPase [Yersinia ruckeri]|uniref:type I secretion system permease/ATPase n=1 Tax=Yersinia ruckeri TaxID=29486 RepID=UPI0020BF827F|nr:type I secretion system permease/ATPase [Yersinia ruckeri]MCW6525398.1 type I secretion system permease/ATPase [Yersinia ruckeri]MCW6538152.1 type I secretion system permease/ATPase [Yersinia ruckeri]MCW6560211.1 type I secretion system permease/ATPase [Yersinia ruckeri]MCW6638236.1 type I secretion system permease/ATPase [Yersinia ruckeri]UZX66524.1 type I secretion system permease/ATPase [Yersinia ruckeri]